MKFCIRVDDIGLSNREADTVPDKLPDTGCEIAKRFHAAMSGLPYVAAVVPAALDEEGGNWIRSRPPGMTVALHGWDHSTRAGVADEFHGMSVKEMRERIDWGQKKIGPVRHYCPPFNGDEKGLYEACYHEGIRYIWGMPSRWPTPPQPWQVYRELLFIPAWRDLYGATGWKQGKDGVPPLLSTLPDYMKRDGVAVLTLHIGWQAAKNPDFSGVAAMADLIRGNVISPEDFVNLTR